MTLAADSALRAAPRRPLGRLLPGAATPAVLYVGVMLLVPFALLVWLSLQQGAGYGQEVTETGIGLENYRRVLTSGVYLDSLLGTLLMGVKVTLLTLIIGYPVAYFVALSGSRFATVAMMVVILPLFVSVVVRSFGWMVLLGRTGIVNDIITGLGLSERPLRLMFTSGAVTVGLVHILAPLMILPIASVLRGTDPALREAARSLGASPIKAFLTVTLPMSLPGIAAGCVLVLAHVIAAFVLPALIGSERIRLMATMIYQQVMVANNIPLGAALAVVMVVATFLLLAVARLATGGSRGR